MPKSRGRRKPNKRPKQQSRAPVGRAPLVGLAQADSAEGLDDATERRFFAMPYVDTRIGDDDYLELDPDSADDRGLLIEGEHPEYHHVLADPAFEGEIDGVNPRLHLMMHEIITNQLWDNDPPEVWQAARRLRDLGEDRHNILHAIGEVSMTLVHASLVDRQNFDLDRYRAELDRLGRKHLS